MVLAPGFLSEIRCLNHLQLKQTRQDHEESETQQNAGGNHSPSFLSRLEHGYLTPPNRACSARSACDLRDGITPISESVRMNAPLLLTLYSTRPFPGRAETRPLPVAWIIDPLQLPSNGYPDRLLFPRDGRFFPWTPSLRRKVRHRQHSLI